MNHPITAPLIAQLITLVGQAGEATLPYWRSGVAVSHKADESPVTAADLAAHEILMAGLTGLLADVPVLSEEAADIPLAVRSQWQRWWLVDPLDGTKEFISGSEEFTVNVALVEQGQVLFGVVGVPATGQCYYGGKGLGAFVVDSNVKVHSISVRSAPSEAFTVVASKRHSSPEQEQLLSDLQANFGQLELANIGSSLKFCLLAEGKADCYPRLAPTSQWDTAAAQGVLEGAGGEVLRLDGSALTYPAQESLLNPFFMALPGAASWRSTLQSLAAKLG